MARSPGVAAARDMMKPAREIELKLEVPPGAAREVISLLGGKGKSKHLHATYYDTPDGALRDRGISFRVRRDDGAFVQTIKVDRGPGGGLFDRSEWERALADATPDFTAIDEADLRDALDGDDGWDAVTPAFIVDVERMVWDATMADGTAEVVFDRGSVIAIGAKSAISEVELELRAGSASLIFALARRIASTAPVRLGVLTKAERGHRLRTARARRATKAEPLTLPGDATTAEAFGRIAETCLRQFRLNEPLIVERDVSGLHQSRVALRRLRSAISMFRKVVADERSDEIRLRQRTLAATLGDARNLDVLIERLHGDCDGALLAELQTKREAAYDRALAALDTADARLLSLDVLEWAELGRWRTWPSEDAAAVLASPARDFAAGVLDRHRRRVKKRGANLSRLDPEQRHQLRIEAKKLRYATEFFSSLFEGKKKQRRARNFRAALEALQDNLGALNDIATGEALAQDLAARGVTLPAIGGEDAAQLLDQAEESHDALVDAKPFWR